MSLRGLVVAVVACLLMLAGLTAFWMVYDMFRAWLG